MHLTPQCKRVMLPCCNILYRSDAFLHLLAREALKLEGKTFWGITMGEQNTLEYHDRADNYFYHTLLLLTNLVNRMPCNHYLHGH